MPTTNTFSISREQEAYIGDTMHKVSRSFALVVPYAEPPLNHYLAAAYLLCRVADNVEDCLQPSDWKQVRFSEILHLLREPHAATEAPSQSLSLQSRPKYPKRRSFCTINKERISCILWFRNHSDYHKKLHPWFTVHVNREDRAAVQGEK